MATRDQADIRFNAERQIRLLVQTDQVDALLDFLTQRQREQLSDDWVRS